MTDAVIPDDRDWTWVLDRPCPECGFVAREFEFEATGHALRRNAGSWADVLSGDPDGLTRRRRSDRWSDLEYGAHVRDVHRRFLERLDMMLTEQDPLFSNWDQDATAVEDAYNTQSPDVVRADLVAAASALADRFDSIAADQRERRGRRSDGARFTVESFARYLVHDPLHHLWDVTGRRVDEH